MKKNIPLPVALPLIRVVRGQRVILDSDLARLYGVATKQLNQQFRRNRRRFPADFAFALSRAEASGMRSQFVTSSREKRNWLRQPIAYTEHGAVMAANVLKSARAVAMSVEVVRAFVQLRKIASSHGNIERILAELESAVIARLDRHDKDIEAIFRLLGSLIQDDPEQSSGIRRVGSA
jgi:DNA-binding transcriptional regulator YdaS (Cro superfamily)